tara:strand:- start:69 stop:299 length:231 start_codon:yes stop_codon:yes gene_type:complete
MSHKNKKKKLFKIKKKIYYLEKLLLCFKTQKKSKNRIIIASNKKSNAFHTKGIAYITLKISIFTNMLYVQTDNVSY